MPFIVERPAPPGDFESPEPGLAAHGVAGAQFRACSFHSAAA